MRLPKSGPSSSAFGTHLASRVTSKAPRSPIGGGGRGAWDSGVASSSVSAENADEDEHGDRALGGRSAAIAPLDMLVAGDVHGVTGFARVPPGIGTPAAERPAGARRGVGPGQEHKETPM